jgi:histidinol-phosphatase (PHP family)
MFDIISHCDIVKKSGVFRSKRVDELLVEALMQIKNADMCIEINTSGMRKPEKEVYPSERILSIARDLKIPLTIGSDAHTPGDVGRDFDTVVDLVEAYGRGKVSLFEKRERTEAKITGLRPNGAR